MKTNSNFLSSFLLIFVFLFIGCQDKSMQMNSPRNIRGVTSYKRTFGDQNKLHLTVAEKYGISPIADREEAEKNKKKLINITNSKYFVVDSLTHSVPYLVPKAYEVLEKIGKNFMDSLTCKGLNPNQVVVTSVLRTKEDVKKLRKKNINAAENSAHFYGTTFDISYKRFKKIEGKRPMQDVNSDTLKLVLAEVLRDMKKEEQCYIMYELKQGCFHITAR